MTHTYANCIVVSFGEATLKHRNFKMFRDRMVENAREKLRANRFDWAVKPIHNRLLIHVPGDLVGSERNVLLEECMRLLAEVPGVSVVAPRRRLDRSEVVDERKRIRYEVLEPLVIEIARETWEEDVEFVVKAKRADRTIDTTSQRIETRIGQAIIDSTEWSSVNLRDAGRVFHIDLYTQGVFIGADRRQGVGGLPVGSSGHLISLLSGGIDSPVAAYLMAKRGCRLDFLHFTADPVQFGGDPEANKVVRMAKRLSEFSGRSRLYLVPEVQFDLAMMGTDTPYHLLIFRRFMTRCAEVLARRYDASAIVVGDSLGQVASQTIENMVSASRALDTPIFRPLLGLDKKEIIELARKIGTYEISIEKYKDCCAMMAHRARTRSRDEALRKIEADALPEYDRVVKESLDAATVVDCRFGEVIRRAAAVT